MSQPLGARGPRYARLATIGAQSTQITEGAAHCDCGRHIVRTQRSKYRNRGTGPLVGALTLGGQVVYHHADEAVGPVEDQRHRPTHLEPQIGHNNNNNIRLQAPDQHPISMGRT